MDVEAEARIPRFSMDAFAQFVERNVFFAVGLAVRFSYELAGRLRCRCRVLAMTRLSLLEMALGMIDLTDVHILFVLLHQNCWSFFYLLVYGGRRIVFLQHNIRMCEQGI
jgi:hypothetical protein